MGILLIDLLWLIQFHIPETFDSSLIALLLRHFRPVQPEALFYLPADTLYRIEGSHWLLEYHADIIALILSQ